jgi:hypothetical protein
LIKPECAADKSQKSRAGEKSTQEKKTNRIAAGVVQDASGLDLRACHFKEVRVLDSGGTGRLASEASEAKIHFLSERAGGFHIPVGDGAHEGDATPRAVAFDLCRIVGRAGWQAHAAVHALLQFGIIDRAQ